jgi:mannose-6-phosphate isomerase-like protein (cupin superfamily)
MKGDEMNKPSKEKATAIENTPGEIIYELIGRGLAESTDRHSVAYVVIHPGKASARHYHPEAEESYYILKGRASISLDSEVDVLVEGEAILIEKGKKHQITNVGDGDLEFIAFCVPAWEKANTVPAPMTE